MIFLNSASSGAALVFYMPGVCTHTDTEGKQRKARVRNIFKNLRKNTIFNEHPVYVERRHHKYLVSWQICENVVRNQETFLQVIFTDFLILSNNNVVLPKIRKIFFTPLKIRQFSSHPICLRQKFLVRAMNECSYVFYTFL